MTAVPDQLATMRAITGTVEASGSTDNPVILGWAAEIGRRFPDLASYCANYTHDAIAWCGLTVGYCMAMAGIRPVFGTGDTARFLYAEAWEQFGSPVMSGNVQPGDVLVFSHHVTLCDGEDGDFYLGRGGNQHDQVKVSRYAKSAAIAVRRPPPAGVVAHSGPIIVPPSRRLAGITATTFADATVAYSDVKPGWNDRPGVALPYRFHGPRPRVRVWKDGRSVDCDIIDVGPWYDNRNGWAFDSYWQTGARPRAESDSRTNHAGIDLTPAADHAIGLNGKGVVDWEFIQESSMTDTTLPAPVVVTMPPTQSTNDKVRNWVHTAFAGILTAIAGWTGINLPATITAATSPKIDPPAIVSTVVKDPQFKSEVNAAVLQFIQSGLPGQAIQASLGFVPGAAPFAGLEPVLRKVIVEVLQQQQNSQATTTKKK
jgi:hypothetical protein